LQPEEVGLTPQADFLPPRHYCPTQPWQNNGDSTAEPAHTQVPAAIRVFRHCNITPAPMRFSVTFRVLPWRKKIRNRKPKTENRKPKTEH